jgi:simple sugar transport system ATP-binding protein
VIARGRLSPSVPAREATIERIGQWMAGLFDDSASTPQPAESAHAQA